MVINHHKLREETIKKFEIFHDHSKKLDWDVVGFVYKHFKDYQEWLKIKDNRENAV